MFNYRKGESKMRRQKLIVAGRDRLIFDALRMMNGDSNASRVGRRAHLSGGTIRNMRREPKRGGTMYPRALTLAKIGRAYGYNLEFVSQYPIRQLSAG